ncbi:MAG: hypothetical protein LDLANPLL_01299 [Turneriella sp.]|nr:hypothetical protein [Turneriella sp.]
MKKIKLTLAFLAMGLFTAPAFSIFQLGVQGNYQSVSYEQGSSNPKTKYAGTGFGGFARFTVGLPMLVTFGAGPYFDYASLSGGPSASPSTKHLRAGGELVVYADIIGNLISLTPYVRFGYGYEGNTAKTEYMASGVSKTDDAVYYGLGGHTIFGLTYKIIPTLYVFAEGGIQWASLKAAIPDTMKNAGVSAADMNSSGWRISLGAMLWL